MRYYLNYNFQLKNLNGLLVVIVTKPGRSTKITSRIDKAREILPDRAGNPEIGWDFFMQQRRVSNNSLAPT
jgi:hypothetical protein